MRIRIGICGVGSFAGNFIPLFKAHPEVENVVLCDLDEAKLSEQCARHGISDRCASMDELCMMDVDAIAIITQHHLHGPQAVQALNAGNPSSSRIVPGTLCLLHPSPRACPAQIVLCCHDQATAALSLLPGMLSQAVQLPVSVSPEQAHPHPVYQLVNIKFSNFPLASKANMYFHVSVRSFLIFRSVVVFNNNLRSEH